MRHVLATLTAAFLAAMIPATLSSQTPPRVTVDAGTLEGTIDSASGVLVFWGIPYAAPPVGPLRWRPPQPAAHWAGMRPATRLSHNCMQVHVWDDIDPFPAGLSEDCLYLNVWTTKVGSSGQRRPVMVWIHGGGFFAGFGGEERHNGARLAEKGAVVVTFNYRLGPFGFLAHPGLAAESPHRASGNYGLLDQVAALQWVKRNISQFGGDPRRVTIFGESAGAVSVGVLMASPLARGIFQRGILESGTGIGSVQPRDSAEAEGVRFASLLDVGGQGTEAIARLRAMSADTLLVAVGMSRAAPPGDGPAVPWDPGPVVDRWVIPTQVDSIFARGIGQHVSVIVGTNRDEGGDGDSWAGAPSRAIARFVTARGNHAYLYQFTRVGDDSVSQRMGAYHSSEITFVFGRPRPLQAIAGHTSYDSTLADAMSDYWVSFAASGDPNGPPNAGRLPRWPLYNAVRDSYLELGPVILQQDGLRRAVYDSLDNIARRGGAIRP
jgi:para-nitrobenzyl esterase